MIDETINPDLAAHSGNVSLVDLRDDRLVLEFGGGCRGCRMVGTTLRRGVADRLREAFPEISVVVDATDHEQGVEPYYA
jgi:Fe/S biogenesis protein NfuA